MTGYELELCVCCENGNHAECRHAFFSGLATIICNCECGGEDFDPAALADLESKAAAMPQKGPF